MLFVLNNARAVPLIIIMLLVVILCLAVICLSSCTVSNSGVESNIVDSVVVETASDTANTVVADIMVADFTVKETVEAEAVPDTVVIYDDDYYENAEYRDGLDVDYQSWMAYWEKRFLDRVKHHDMKYFKKHIHYPLRVGESLTLRSEKDFAVWQDKIFDSEFTNRLSKCRRGQISRIFWCLEIVDESGEPMLILDYKGRICIMYQVSNSIKKENERLRMIEQQKVHKSCRGFDYNVLTSRIPKYSIRIDKYGDTYALSMWKAGRPETSSPDVHITDGLAFYEGFGTHPNYWFMADTLEVRNDTVIANAYRICDARIDHHWLGNVDVLYMEGVKLVSGRLLDNYGHQEWLEHGEKFDTIVVR